MSDYKWRPNDNSVTTKLRYDLEAEHWAKSYKSALEKNKPVNFAKDLAVIGLIISLVVTLIWFILLCILDFYIWVRKKIQTKKQKKILAKIATKELAEKLAEKKRFDIMFNTKNVFEDLSPPIKSSAPDIKSNDLKTPLKSKLTKSKKDMVSIISIGKVNPNDLDSFFVVNSKNNNFD